MDKSMEYKDKSGKKQVLFDAATTKVVQKVCLPESQQEPNESRRQVVSLLICRSVTNRFRNSLWAGVTRAIKASDMESATAEKSKIEEAQREKVRAREASGQRHQLRFFEPVGEKYMPNIGVDR